MGIFNPTIKIKVSRLDDRAELPKRNHTNKFADAAYDLFAFDKTLPLNPLEVLYVQEELKAAGKTEDTLKDKTPEDVLYDQLDEVSKTLILQSGQRRLVGTGIRLAIPDGYWVKFHERSGLANKGIHILGGVIDSGYTGELKVIMYNSGSNSYEHDCHKAIAQFTVERVTNSCMELISEEDMEFESSLRERKDKGFGSSDAK